MTVPVLLITGYLGAGKTTLVNRLLTEPQGRRLAVLVNDFGAVDIDAQMLAGASDGVVSLKNGCICCSLQGDLLRTLSAVLRRDGAPDGIVIETSGVSDPAEIVRALLDPMVWQAAALDAVICAVDARQLADQQSLPDDPLFRSQLGAADFVALTKTDLVDAAERAQVIALLGALTPDRAIHESVQGRMPPELLFSAQLHRPKATARRGGAFTATASFQSVSWTARLPLAADRFQAVINRFAPRLVRAKGLIHFADRHDQTMVFQLVGRRATIGPAPANVSTSAPTQIVFIAKEGALDEAELIERLAGCLDGADVRDGPGAR